MTEYTPTVDAFRGVYGEMCAVWCREDALAEFDRFIARIQAEARGEGRASAGITRAEFEDAYTYWFDGPPSRERALEFLWALGVEVEA